MLFRIPKCGSTHMGNLLNLLSENLDFMVLRGRYHSYKYWTNNDKIALGHFLETAAGKTRHGFIIYNMN